MTGVSAHPLFGIILAGGTGTRFWPLSRLQYPKQVLRLLGSESLLQSTIERLLPKIPEARLAVVTSAPQADIIRLELFRRGWRDIQLWLEPEGRNTAAAVGLAAVLLPPEAGAVIMAVFPADHFIRDQARFHQALDQGAALAQAGYLVTFGITPTRPDTGYGYIKAGEPLEPGGQGFRSLAFIEKPELPRAQAFLKEGGYFWNSGIFLFRRDVLLQAFARHLPEFYAGLTRLLKDFSPETLAAVYAQLPIISLDRGILERADNVTVVPVEMGWSDVGTWGALAELCDQDEQGNVLLGRVLDLGSHHCLVVAQNRLVATIGLKDVIVVDTPDATLVCHKNRGQEVKDLVGELNRLSMVESVQHPTVERPWGRYTVMDAGPGYQVKQIVVDPGKRLSLQWHQHRAEHWVVVQGAARITIGQETRLVKVNQSVFVPLKTPHRLENPGPEPLRIIEIQTGSYLGEDDIVRLADDFWRLSEPVGRDQA
jgi:mannose-1-phosphate guanylyltransferase/mannose-6-phosphate isomerase